MKNILSLDISRQPDDTTCGPTCLHAVYSFYQNSIPLEQVIEEVDSLRYGGTLAVMLGVHALKRGYKAKIQTFNLRIFDPTWFAQKTNLTEKLEMQKAFKTDDKFQDASNAYIEFLQLGGQIEMEDLNGKLIRKYLNRGIPILTGLSATYLYSEARELPYNGKQDDLKGVASGHFVILNGYDMEHRKIAVADPLNDNPFQNHHYQVSADKLICAILLGVLTYDANLLIIEK